ncbi:MAG: hypothetical protein JO306_14175, partial [Gemmatimonadetes bacterium]|nr:hypothetical protein [Gemmatimonadota bacterium]
MEKIRMEVSELRVESFPTDTKDEKARGTVLAHATSLCDQTVPFRYC